MEEAATGGPESHDGFGASLIINYVIDERKVDQTCK